jgi:hypothetical protein
MTAAGYYLKSQKEVLRLLREVAMASGPSGRSDST